MCEFHESTCNGFGDIWWTDNPIYFSSIDEMLFSHHFVKSFIRNVYFYVTFCTQSMRTKPANSYVSLNGAVFYCKFVVYMYYRKCVGGGIKYID